MARFGLVGPDYSSQSPIADCQVLKNWYYEVIESQQGKSAAALYPTPGLAVFSPLPNNIRRNGLFTINGRLFAVSANVLYEVFASGSSTIRGTVGNDGNPVSMAAAEVIADHGSPQLAIVSAGKLYVFNMILNTLSAPIIDLVGIPLQIVYVDGFFILLHTNGEIQFSAPLDATTWNAVESQATTSYPDQTVGIGSVHRQLFTLSNLKGTTYYNAGDQPIPFDEVSGGDFEQGTGAPWSIVPLDNTLFFIGQNKEGAGVAWRLAGYTPQRISNHAIEFAWQGYSTISDAVCYGYQDQGHTFYVCYFPTANVTWVYDVATQMWHQREFWNAATGQKSAHLSCCHAYCFGMHLVGDWSSGNIYQMSISQTMDNGNLIKRIRRAPHISNENEWMYYQQLQVDVQVGLQPSQILTGIATPTSINLQDSTGKYWNMGMSNVGAITSTSAVSQHPSTLFLNDSTGASSWQIIPQPLSGTLNPTPAPFNAAYPTYLLMYSANGQSQWRVSVTKISSTVAQFHTQFVATVYRNPTMNLRWSDDGGQSWSNYHPADTGTPGNYKARTIWRRLGRSRDRVFEIQVTDPIPWRIVDAYLKATPGYVPSERLTDRARKVA